MKRAFILALALLTLSASLTGLAEAALTPAEGQNLTVDLDGDGVNETLYWRMVPGEHDTYLELSVADAEGVTETFPTEILYGEGVYVADLDGDGAQEILLSGDVMSDDYCTWCLHYADGELHELLFPDGSRGENGEGYYKVGYGQVTALGDGKLTLTGSQDALGTWMGSRTLALTPWERFEFADAGFWLRDVADPADPDLWEYGALTLTTALPYTDLQGRPAGTLQPGDRILIYATDKRETVCFATPDGMNGALSISFDYERGYGWLVDGIPETDCFEYVPYAD